MTVPYIDTLPSKFSSVGWVKTVLLKWRGSIYKLIVLELVVFVALWYVIWTLIDRVGENDRGRIDGYITSFRDYQSTVRLMMSFMLVYYYSQIYERAKTLFFAIPFPDEPFLVISSTVGGADAKSRMLRHTIFRYVLATTFICYYSASSKFRGVYPDPFDSLIELGLLTHAEADDLRRRRERFPYVGELACTTVAWAIHAVRNAYSAGEIYPRDKTSNTFTGTVRTTLEALIKYRRSYSNMLFQVYLPFPLLISQLVTIVVYMYFATALFAQQNLRGESVFYFPLFTSMEFITYVGALRVGQCYSNPLGRDDDDYELVAFFNRNLRLAHLYGGFGSDEFDILATQRPVVDLASTQDTVLNTTPVAFYTHESSSTDAFGTALQESWLPRNLPPTPTLAASSKLDNSHEPGIFPTRSGSIHNTRPIGASFGAD